MPCQPWGHPGEALLPSPPTLRGTGCWGAVGCNPNRKAGRDPALPSWDRRETHWVVLRARAGHTGSRNGDTQGLNRAHPRVTISQTPLRVTPSLHGPFTAHAGPEGSQIP